MWQEPGLKMVSGISRPARDLWSLCPSLLEKQEGVVRPFRNQFCQLADKPELAPKIGLHPNSILELGDWDMNQAQMWQGPYHGVMMYIAESAASKGSHFSPSRLVGTQDLECATVASSSWP